MANSDESGSNPECPWLDLAKAEIGTAEIKGKKDNPKILQYYADAGHPEIEHDEVAWCAAFVGSMLYRAGYPSTRSLAARSYLTYGTKLDGPQEGCIAVLTRGNPKSWEGHVAFVVGFNKTTVKLLGGNQSDQVCVESFQRSKVIGWRMPVAPTVKALREAGSTEIKSADGSQKAIIAGGLATTGVAAIGQAVDSSTVAAPTVPSLDDAAGKIGYIQTIADGIASLGKLLIHNPWIAGLVVMGLAIWWISRSQKLRRVERALLGHPLSNES